MIPNLLIVVSEAVVVIEIENDDYDNDNDYDHEDIMKWVRFLSVYSDFF